MAGTARWSTGDIWILSAPVTAVRCTLAGSVRYEDRNARQNVRARSGSSRSQNQPPAVGRDRASHAGPVWDLGRFEAAFERSVRCVAFVGWVVSLGRGAFVRWAGRRSLRRFHGETRIRRRPDRPSVTLTGLGARHD